MICLSGLRRSSHTQPRSPPIWCRSLVDERPSTVGASPSDIAQAARTDRACKRPPRDFPLYFPISTATAAATIASSSKKPSTFGHEIGGGLSSSSIASAPGGGPILI